MGKWAKNPQTRINTHFSVPTYAFKSGQKTQINGQKTPFYKKSQAMYTL